DAAARRPHRQSGRWRQYEAPAQRVDRSGFDHALFVLKQLRDHRLVECVLRMTEIIGCMLFLERSMVCESSCNLDRRVQLVAVLAEIELLHQRGYGCRRQSAG